MEFTRISAFMQHLFDREAVAQRAAKIVAGILERRCRACRILPTRARSGST